MNDQARYQRGIVSNDGYGGNTFRQQKQQEFKSLLQRRKEKFDLLRIGQAVRLIDGSEARVEELEPKRCRVKVRLGRRLLECAAESLRLV